MPKMSITVATRYVSAREGVYGDASIVDLFIGRGREAWPKEPSASIDGLYSNVNKQDRKHKLSVPNKEEFARGVLDLERSLKCVSQMLRCRS